MSSSPTTDSREDLAAAALPADVVSENEPPIRRQLPNLTDADVVFLPPPHQPPAEAALEPPVVGAETVEPVVAERVPQSWPIYLWWVLCKTLEWLFGLASVVGCLAVLSAVPLVQFVSLGYLLEASARVARSGKLRHGFIDMPKFARIGSLVFGTWIMLLPMRFLSALAQDAYLVDPTGNSARAWRVGQLICTGLMLGHILLAWYSGGKLRHFFWPFLAPFQIGAKLVFGTIIGPIVRPLVEAISPRLAADLYIERPLSSWFPPAILWAGIVKGKMYRRTRDAVWDFVASLRLPQYFWLGVRGFVGALTWIAIPALLMMGGTTLPNGGLAFVSGWLGAFLLGIVLIYLPFAQTHMAVQNRFVEIFNLGEVRRQFSRAPIAWWLALTTTLLFAVPLYLLTIEATQREVTYLINLFFVAFIYPARLVLGWAMGRALHRDKPRFIVIGLMARFAAIPVVLGYLIILWASQYTAWFGPFSLMVQHAFMVPVPFIGV
ncbi:MAG: DUF4013 domain-containing protein [Pirellulaceae bacterium]